MEYDGDDNGNSPQSVGKNTLYHTPSFFFVFVGSLNERLGGANLAPSFQVLFICHPRSESSMLGVF